MILSVIDHVSTNGDFMNSSEWFEKTFGEINTSVRKDLNNNLQKLLESGEFTKQEAAALLVGCGQSLKLDSVVQYGVELMKAADFSSDQITEAKESAAIMGMNNIYYRFRHLLKDGQGAEHAENYKMTGLRMTSLAKPHLGKELFELLAFAISCINGCGMCINAHEVELRKHNVEINKIHNAARLAAVLKGISAF
jgi:lipoyl-dependent peroxiredoxin subunit D